MSRLLQIVPRCPVALAFRHGDRAGLGTRLILRSTRADCIVFGIKQSFWVAKEPGAQSHLA